MTNELKNWLDTNLIPYKVLAPKLFSISSKRLCLLEPTNGKILDLKGGEATLVLSPFAKKMVDEKRVDHLAFEFGGWFYFTPIDQIVLKNLHPLKYLLSSRSKDPSNT